MHLVQYWQLGMFGCTTYILSANTAQPNPGIRPIAIGVGEVLRRITGKAVFWSFKADVYISGSWTTINMCQSWSWSWSSHSWNERVIWRWRSWSRSTAINAINSMNRTSTTSEHATSEHAMSTPTATWSSQGSALQKEVKFRLWRAQPKATL